MLKPHLKTSAIWALGVLCTTFVTLWGVGVLYWWRCPEIALPAEGHHRIPNSRAYWYSAVAPGHTRLVISTVLSPGYSPFQFVDPAFKQDLTREDWEALDEKQAPLPIPYTLLNDPYLREIQIDTFGRPAGFVSVTHIVRKIADPPESDDLWTGPVRNSGAYEVRMPLSPTRLTLLSACSAAAASFVIICCSLCFRTRRRVSRGLCVRCAYPWPTGSPVCPECGEPSRQGQAPPSPRL